jgi:RNA polymerase sigma factor (sigma-70 family)
MEQIGRWVAMACEAQAPRYGERGGTILGDVFLRVARAVEGKSEIRDLQAYVAVCCRRAIRHACHRERKKDLRIEDEDGVVDRNGRETTPLSRMIRSEETEALKQAREKLPEEEREALDAWCEASGRNEAMSNLAKRKQRTRQASYQQKERAVARLRRMLGVHKEEEDAG